MNDAARLTTYPPIEPFRTGFLKVGGPHEIYYEVSGNPEGKPVIIVHGGPGGGELDHQVGKCRVQRRHQVRHQEGRHAVDAAQPEIEIGPLRGAADLQPGSLAGGEQRARPRHQRPPRRRQHQPAAAALEQRRLHLLLELAQGVAEGGLGEVHVARGGAHRAEVDDAQEDPQAAQIHQGPLWMAIE